MNIIEKMKPYQEYMNMVQFKLQDKINIIMNKEEIKDFLRNKPGYLKEGGKRLKGILDKRNNNINTFFEKKYISGIDPYNLCTIEDCKAAIREVQQELREYPYIKGFDPYQEVNIPKILFYDIEVSYGLARAWRPGWKVRLDYDDFVTHPKIICISYKWNNSDEVFTVQWDKKQDDKRLLEEFIPVLNEADFIVGHNGDKFDLPWIRTRALYHGLDMHPLYTSVDTLKIARYKYRFPSNRLDNLGDYLGIGRKIKVDRNLWVDTVCKGDREALDKMVEYCEQDVFLLEDVYNKLSQQTLQRIHFGVLKNNDVTSSPYIKPSKIRLVKTRTTGMGTKRRIMECLNSGKYFEMSEGAYKKYLKNIDVNI